MIPKKIHYCWFGGNTLPERDQACIESWKKYCPDYEIIRWDESNYDLSQCDYMKEAYEAKRYGFVPDFARLDIIYQHGGIYLDTDVEIIKSLDPLLELEGFAGFEATDAKEKFIALGLGFGAQKGNPIIKALRDDYFNHHFIRPNGEPNLTPAPRYTNAVLTQMGILPNGTLQEMDGFKFFPEEYFCPKSDETNECLITEDTFSIHHYNASWFTPKERIRADLVKKWKKRLGGTLGYPIGTLIYYIKEEGFIKLFQKLNEKIRKK